MSTRVYYNGNLADRDVRAGLPLGGGYLHGGATQCFKCRKRNMTILIREAAYLCSRSLWQRSIAPAIPHKNYIPLVRRRCALTRVRHHKQPTFLALYQAGVVTGVSNRFLLTFKAERNESFCMLAMEG